MPFWDRPSQRSLTVSGDIVLLRITVESGNEREDDPLWSMAREANYELREQISFAVHRYLGPEFEIRNISFTRGSLGILVVIGTVFYAVSRYKSFLDSLALLMAQLQRLITIFFNQRMQIPVSVRTDWSPGPALVVALQRTSASPHDISQLVIWYLIVSHGAMLAVLLWLLTRALRH